MKGFIPKSRHDQLVVQEVDGEVLIYDLRTDTAVCLNSTSALIWQACDGNRNITEISEFVSQKLNTKSNEDLIWLAIDQLKKEKLLENDTEAIIPFAGMSRRDVIKKIGLASAVTLPIVASLVAPLAVHAKSGCPTAGCTCPNPLSTTCVTPTCTSPNPMITNCVCGPNPPGPAGRMCQ